MKKRCICWADSWSQKQQQCVEKHFERPVWQPDWEETENYSQERKRGAEKWEEWMTDCLWDELCCNACLPMCVYVHMCVSQSMRKEGKIEAYNSNEPTFPSTRMKINNENKLVKAVFNN